jgi:hypothetical protein
LACADFQVDTGSMPSKIVVNHILDKFKTVTR